MQYALFIVYSILGLGYGMYLNENLFVAEVSLMAAIPLGWAAGYAFQGICEARFGKRAIWSAGSLAGVLAGMYFFGASSDEWKMFFDGSDGYVYEDPPSISLVYWFTFGGWLTGLIAHTIWGEDEEEGGGLIDEYSTKQMEDIRQAVRGSLEFAPGKAQDWQPVPKSNAVGLEFTNAKGKRRITSVHPCSLHISHNTLHVVDSHGHNLYLRPKRIHNPEVLGFVMNQTAEGADRLETECPTCGDFAVRQWSGSYRCWTCGYVLRAEQVQAALGNTSQSAGTTDAVKIWYYNNQNVETAAWVDPTYVEVSGGTVTIQLADGTGELTLPHDCIINPEVLGLDPAEAPVEDGTVVLLKYLNNHQQHRQIRVQAKANLFEDGQVHLKLAESNGSMVMDVGRILNLDVLDLTRPEAETEAEPPILEPAELFIGDVSGKELQYTRQDGRRGIIYFAPGDAEIIDTDTLRKTRVLITPKSCAERYSILLESVINPEVIYESDEPPPIALVIPDPPAEQYEPGMRVVLEEVPLDSYEAVKVMRSLQPELGPFEIFEELRNENSAVLQGLKDYRAKDLQEDFQKAGCRVSLMNIEAGSQPAVAEPPPAIETGKPRPPTEEEFHEIRFGIDGDRVTHLITSGELNLNARDSRGVPLLHGSMNPRFVDLLISYGADPQTTDPAGNTALHSCMESTVLAELVRHGLSPNGGNLTGQTALHHWANHGRPEAVQALLTAGADANFRDLSGQTALDLANAATFNNETELEAFNQVIALLQEHTTPAAEPELPPVIEEELPPVIEPARQGRQPTEEEFNEVLFGFDAESVRKFVLERNLDVNAKNKYGEPLIFNVVDKSVVEMLLTIGADPNARDADGATALFNCHDSNIAQLLIQHGTDVNAHTEHGQSALTGYCDLETFRVLLENGANLNGHKNSYSTPLIHHAGMGYYDKAKLLIDFGADINRKTKYGDTPLQAATTSHWDINKPDEADNAHGCQQIAELLRSLGAK